MLNSLTSLRFFAAFAIVLHHSRGLIFRGEFLQGIPLAAGVSFFFVLSGFILSHAYGENINVVGKKRFYIARLARIWPLHILTMLIFFIIFPIKSCTLGATPEILVSALNATLLQAIVPIPAYYFSFNSVSWSISTEMFFYIFFPFLVFSIEKNWNLKLAILIAFGGVSAYAVDHSGIGYYSPQKLTEVSGHGFAYINPLLRVQEFFAGMLFYILYKKFNRSIDLNKAFFTIIEIASVIFLILFTKKILGVSYSYFGGGMQASSEFLGNVLMSILFGVIILIFSFGKGLISFVLGFRLFVILGEASFSLYMIHQIIFRYYAANKNILSGFSEYQVLSILSCIAILLACLIWKFYEIPAKKLILKKFTSA